MSQTSAGIFRPGLLPRLIWSIRVECDGNLSLRTENVGNCSGAGQIQPLSSVAGKYPGDRRRSRNQSLPQLYNLLTPQSREFLSNPVSKLFQPETRRVWNRTKGRRS